MSLRRYSLTARVMLMIGLTMLMGCTSEPDYHTADSQSGRFSDHQGKWLVINYWAIWCKPCRDEIPELNEFQKHHKNVTVMGVDFDQNPPTKLQRLIQELNIQFTVLLHDPASYFGWDQPLALPMTFVINPQGKLSATLSGPQTLETLNEAINAKP